MSLRQAFHKLLNKNLDGKAAHRTQRAYTEVLSGESGEELLEDLCVKFKLFEPAPDNETALRRDAQRAVISYLWTMRHDAPRVQKHVEDKVYGRGQ